MGKRKADNELERFVWKRNIRYDIQLLCEIEQLNPYALKNQKPAWEEIAVNLLECSMEMKVTARSCRERAGELLKAHRSNERSSIQTSGVGNEKETAFQTLLTSVSKLEEAKPSKVVKALFSTEDRHEADATRDKALNEVETDSEKDGLDTSTEEKSSDDFEFGPAKTASGKPSKPKSQLVVYLEKKNEGEMAMRKEELSFRKEELAVKNKEIEIQRLKAEAEAEQSKKMMELIVKLVNPASKN